MAGGPEKHSSGLLKKYNFPAEELDETEFQAYGVPTGYPPPEGNLKYRMIYETAQQYIEEHYYWIIHNLRYDFGFTHFDKITDIFAASEQSSFFGVSEQRLAAQQDRISQFLRGISEMLKALFQVVREIRVIDERLTFYYDSFKRGDEAEGSEITLKGIWVDQVEGGVKNAGSVYGLSQTVGFTILPDLFFRIKVQDKDLHLLAEKWDQFQSKTAEFPKLIDEKVNKLEFNEKVKEVLKRKLIQYYTWKMRTFKELYTRKKFTIKYLRQHYETIRLYMGWIKPYLRNVRKLTQDSNKQDSYELVSAFEGSMVEVEVLLSRQLEHQTEHPCVLLSFFFRSRPAMGYVGEGYQRGPTHVGKMDLTMRGYVWNSEQIQNYKNMRMEEDFELLSTIDEAIKQALDSLGEELKLYLSSEGEEFVGKPMPKKDHHKQPGVLDPFAAIFTGFKEIPGAFGGGGGHGGGGGLAGLRNLIPGLKQKGGHDEHDHGHSKSAEQLYVEKQFSKNLVKRSLWLTWKNFKITHGMLQW